MALSSRAIIGRFYDRLEQNAGESWMARVSALFTSNQPSEEYRWLGQAPSMREWVGGRQAKQLLDIGMLIRNKHYEATLEVSTDDLFYDKTGQIMVRVNEMADRTNAHWAKLLSALIVAGESSVGYDGQYFFDTDHSEGDSGSQSNDLTYNAGTPTAPTSGEMEQAIIQAVTSIIGIKDDTGEPSNEDARRFLVMTPVSLMAPAAAALGSQIIIDSSTSRSNTIQTLGSIGGFQIELAVNPRLTWTDKFAVFRTDGQMAPFIRQEERPVEVDAIAEGSELEFEHRKHRYGVHAVRAAGYGMWQRAALMTLT